MKYITLIDNGYLGIPVQQEIKGWFLRGNTLIVIFEKEKWILKETGNQKKPFVWKKYKRGY